MLPQSAQFLIRPFFKLHCKYSLHYKCLELYTNYDGENYCLCEGCNFECVLITVVLISLRHSALECPVFVRLTPLYLP